LQAFLLAFPKKVIEQKAIVDYIKKATKLINNAISKFTAELDYIMEYRASLISSVVTGKVNVKDVVVPDFKIEDEVVGSETKIFHDKIEAAEVDN